MNGMGSHAKIGWESTKEKMGNYGKDGTGMNAGI